MHQDFNSRILLIIKGGQKKNIPSLQDEYQSSQSHTNYMPFHGQRQTITDSSTKGRIK